MRAQRRSPDLGPAVLGVAVLGVVVAVALVLAGPGAAATSGPGDGVPVGLTVLGALLGVLVFATRLWWERSGRGGR